MPAAKPVTAKAYLASLPADRRRVIAAVRDVILANLPDGYEEGMQYGMLAWSIPHRLYPAGYHADPKQPLPFAALASQKRHCSLYLMSLYCGCADPAAGETADSAWFRKAWTATGRKLDMGASCVRFRTLEDVPLDVVGAAIARVPVRTYLEHYEAMIAAKGTKRPRAKR